MGASDLISGIIKSVASIEQIPQVISVFFENINNFLTQLQIFFLNSYVLLIIAIFFAMLILTGYGIFKAYPYFLQHRKLIDRLIKLS